MACGCYTIAIVRPPSRRLFCQSVGLLLLVLTALAPRPSACARPLITTTGSDIILLPAAAVPAAAAASSGGGAEATPAQPEDHQTMLPPAAAGDRCYQWVLDRKPRGKPPPSAPSKRTN